jgi:hypothetical protein
MGPKLPMGEEETRVLTEEDRRGGTRAAQTKMASLSKRS